MKSSFFKFNALFLLLPAVIFAREPEGYVGPRYLVVQERDYDIPPPSGLGLSSRQILGMFDLENIPVADRAELPEMNPLTNSGGTTTPPDVIPPIMQISSRNPMSGSLSGSLLVRGRNPSQPSVGILPDADNDTLRLTFSRGVGGLRLTVRPSNGGLNIVINGEYSWPVISFSFPEDIDLTIIDPLGASIRTVEFINSSEKTLVGNGVIYGDLAPLDRAIPDLLISDRKPVRLKGDDIYDQRRASRKQTIGYKSRIFTNTRVSALLWMENDGGETERMTLQSSGDRFPGMSAFAKEIGKNGRKNITAALKRGNFSAMVEPGFPVKVSYSLKTNRFWAGVLRGGNRNDTIRFRLSGAGQRDNAALDVKYNRPAGSPRL